MKIAIVGPGAMGLLLAAFLSKAKEELWLLDYEKNRANRISQSGIKVEGLSGEWSVKAKITVDPKEIGSVDLVIVCVKSYDTKAALTHAKPLIGDDTAVLTLQNGIGNIEIISEVIGPDRVIGGVTNLGSTLIDTGKVRFAGKGDTIIGRLDGKIPVEMRDIREIFNKVGLEMRISRDVKSLLWSKLIINVGINALTALTRLQ
ncbi:MAG: 2-dehydropantoate 2-reductase, partial [Candidatus Omnitrophica bacterium]|nr:2-dehydropantoate 2-reductase [Candidatus Omnitrophota bacterium]